MYTYHIWSNEGVRTLATSGSNDSEGEHLPHMEGEHLPHLEVMAMKMYTYHIWK